MVFVVRQARASGLGAGIFGRMVLLPRHRLACPRDKAAHALSNE
jgi:hypothetical protein